MERGKIFCNFSLEITIEKISLFLESLKRKEKREGTFEKIEIKKEELYGFSIKYLLKSPRKRTKEEKEKAMEMIEIALVPKENKTLVIIESQNNRLAIEFF